MNDATAMVDANGTGDAGCDGACVITFASGTDWTAYDVDPASSPDAGAFDAGPRGEAQPVCLNASSPPGCPANAVLYGFAASAWTLDRSSIAPAVWVWSPGVTGSAPADLERAVFAKTFSLGSVPAGSISIAADDYAEVHVNGVFVGKIGSVSDQSAAGGANSSLTTFNISPFLAPGANTITVVAQNGPASFAGCPSACDYAHNPAGTVFGGQLSYH